MPSLRDLKDDNAFQRCVRLCGAARGVRGRIPLVFPPARVTHIQVQLQGGGRARCFQTPTFPADRGDERQPPRPSKRLDFSTCWAASGEHSSALCSTDQAEQQHGGSTRAHACVCVCPLRGSELWQPGHSGLGELQRDSVSQLFNLATWVETGRTGEGGCQYSACVCLITFPFVSQLWHPHISPIISPHARKVTGVYMAWHGTGRMIIRWVLISQVSRTDMNNTGHFITPHPPPFTLPSLSVQFYYYSSSMSTAGAISIPWIACKSQPGEEKKKKGKLSDSGEIFGGSVRESSSLIFAI